MAFLLGTFLGIRQLLDLGSSSAFFTFLSQRRRSMGFVRAFYAWLAGQFLIPAAVLAWFAPPSWIEAVWQGEDRKLVILAFAAAFLQNSLWPVVQQAAEAGRQTVRVQAIGLMVAVVHLAATTLLWRMGVLGLHAIFVAIAAEYLLASVVAHQWCIRVVATETGLEEEPPRAVLRSYWRYCLPLAPYAAACFVYEFADRWLLQNFGGGVEQAYYAVGAQFAALALIGTTSILRIFWKEIAEANHRRDEARMRCLYRRTCRLMFLASALISGLVLPWTDELLLRILGPAYVGGSMTMAIMFLYPVHQSLGQVAGTMLYATERTDLQVKAGLIFMFSSIVATYFLLAPPSATLPGLGLASEGLAIKMVVMQFIQVNGVAFLIARIWKWPFDWAYQPASLAACLCLGWLAKQVALWVPGVGAAGSYCGMAVAALAFALFAAALIHQVPSLAGLTRQEMTDELVALRCRVQVLLRAGAPGT